MIKTLKVKTMLKRFLLGRRTSYGSWTADNVGYDLAESLSTFCSCAESFPETKIKGNGLVNIL